MKFGTLPEVVTYTEFGVEHKALVVGGRELEHHTGVNGELLLDLVIVKPVVRDECVNCHFPERNHGKPFPPGASHVPCAKFEGIAPIAAVNPSEYVHIVTDVAHESHAFTDEQLKELASKGLTAYPGGAYPGGRWREIDADTGTNPFSAEAGFTPGIADASLPVGTGPKEAAAESEASAPASDDPPATVN